MARRRGRAVAHSLWLRPSGAAHRRLARLIVRLARRCGTEPFDPHVTLLGGIALRPLRAIERTAALAGVLRPFAVRLREAGHEAAPFRCLYLRASGPGLRKARARAVLSMGEASGPPGTRRAGARFRPHLSLVYGRLPAAIRRSLAREIGKSLAQTFVAREVVLVRTSGAVRSWRIVAVRRFRS